MERYGAALSVEELAWAAGLFEGEGTASITSGGARWRTRARCSVPSTDIFTAAYFQARWGGTVHTARRGGNARDCYVWQISGDGMMQFLLELRPYIRRPIVQERFDLLMEDHDTRRQGARDPQYREQRLQFLQRSALLNARGRER